MDNPVCKNRTFTRWLSLTFCACVSSRCFDCLLNPIVWNPSILAAMATGLLALLCESVFVFFFPESIPVGCMLRFFLGYKVTQFPVVTGSGFTFSVSQHEGLCIFNCARLSHHYHLITTSGGVCVCEPPHVPQTDLTIRPEWSGSQLNTVNPHDLIPAVTLHVDSRILLLANSFMWNSIILNHHVWAKMWINTCFVVICSVCVCVCVTFNERLNVTRAVVFTCPWGCVRWIISLFNRSVLTSTLRHRIQDTQSTVSEVQFMVVFFFRRGKPQCQGVRRHRRHNSTLKWCVWRRFVGLLRLLRVLSARMTFRVVYGAVKVIGLWRVIFDHCPLSTCMNCCISVLASHVVTVLFSLTDVLKSTHGMFWKSGA